VSRDLYISTFAPTLGSGRAQRTYTCVRALALLGPLDLAYVPFEGDGPSPEYESIEGLELYPIYPSRRFARAASYASMRLRGVPNEFARGVSPELVREAERLATQRERGRVVVGDLSAAAALLRLSRRIPIVYNAHNAGPAYFNPAQTSTPLSRLASNAFERRLLRYSSESWMVSQRDIDAARSLEPKARLRYVPNAVDVASIHPVEDTSHPRERLLMVGDFLYAPNRTGRNWLVSEVMPLVWQAVPQAQLTLVGRGCDDWSPPDSRIEVAGFVEDLDVVYQQSDCVVVPVSTGGGSPLKFVEALAYRVPVVATPFAAGGLEVVAGKHYLQGSDAPSFAAGILEVLQQGAPHIATGGRRIAEERYSVESVAQRIAEHIG
jgi:glycosyltransferase involved in cell wall biosynthesis